MKTPRLLTLLCWSLLSSTLSLDWASAQQPGTLDETFAAGSTPENAIYALAQAGSKVILGGDFTKIGEAPRNRIARLNEDGTLDMSFDTGDGFNTTVAEIAVRPDGKILAGGSFTQYRGSSTPYFAVLNQDGSLGGTMSAAPNSYVWAILPLANGDAMIGGLFTALGGSNTRQYIARVKSDGSIDASFTARVNGTVLAIAQQPDGQLLIGGDFTSVGGQSRNRIARISLSGALDPSFDPGAGADGSVRVIRPLADRILVAGNFGTVNGAASRFLAMLLPSGLPDITFAPQPDSYVYDALVQNDGRIVGVGEFTRKIGRVRANGGSDPTFDVGSGANTAVWAIIQQPNGDLVAGGAFTQVNGVSRPYLARFKGAKIAAGGQLDFATSSYTVIESEANVTLEVRRTGNTASSITVDIATSNGTATAGDYVPKTETLAFAPGETRKTFVVTIRQDTQVEDDETFNVTLSNPTGDAELGLESSAEVRIVSEDKSTVIGSVDTSFGSGVVGTSISALTLNSEGKIVVAGDFRAIGGQSRYSIARLDADGSPDPTFRPGAWANGTTYAVAVQDDGKVLLGGTFSQVNGVSQSYLARLNRDGSYDSGFNPGGGPNSYVYSLLPLPFGDMLVGGSFSQFSGVSAPYLIKLFSDGSVDTTFNPQVDSTVLAIAMQPDGKFLIGGDFNHVGGEPRLKVARLNSDGSLDKSFDPGAGTDGSVQTIALQTDGKIIIGGRFGTVNRGPWRYVARLLPSGLPDPSFNASIDNIVYAALIQPDGRILLGGDFSGRVARLLSSGAFDPTTSGGSGGDGTVSALALQSDGQVIAGGSFRHFGSFTRNGLVRLRGLSDAAGGAFEFSKPRYVVSESEPTVIIEVTRSGPTTQPASVDFATAPGSATAGDFVPQSNRLNFTAGEKTRSITIAIRQETTSEDDESFSVTLSNPGGGAELGAQRSTEVIIQNDDIPLGAGNLELAFGGKIDGSSVNTIAVAEDDKIIVGGDFRVVFGASRVNLTRLLPDGSVDETFAPSLWFDGPVYCAAIQDDGKILVGGAFYTVSGFARRFIARLNADGTLDQSFNASQGINQYVYTIVTLSEGDILIGGGFSRFDADPQNAYLVKLFGDGSLDTSFSPQLNSNVLDILLQPDGKILIGGDFTSAGGSPRNRIARLNSDGTLDKSFDAGAGADGSVRALALQNDGKVLIGGAFGTVNGSPQRYLARLMPTGLPDWTLAQSLDGQVYSLQIQLDGKILAGGDFGGKLARLNNDGTIDLTHSTSATGANSTVLAVALQPDGNILAGGSFTVFNGLARNYLVLVQGLNDSSGGEIEFSTPFIAVSESQPSVSVEIRRAGSIGTAVTVDYATASGSANTGDYVAQNGTIIFGPSDTRKNITLSIRSDAQPEDTESFSVTLDNVTGGASLGANRVLQIQILNDDFFEAPGTLDLRFGGDTSGSAAYAVAGGANGSVFVGGDFRSMDGASRYNFARITGEGRVDNSFDPSLWFNGPVYAIKPQADGKVLVGGAFTAVSTAPRNFLARLNANGTLDNSFNLGSGPNSHIYAVELLPGGEILAGGIFSSYSGESRYGMVKLFSDGTRDASFDPQLNSYVYSIVAQPNGKILIGGDFTSVRGQTVNRIARLNADGSLDTSFDAGQGPNSTVRTIALQSDGKIFVGGNFTLMDGKTQNYMARLLANGHNDDSFGVGFNGIVYSIQTDSSGNALVGGSFTSPQTYFVHLKPDGSIAPESQLISPLDSTVYSLTLDSAGHTILGGSFSHVANLTRGLAARLNGAAAMAGFRFTRAVAAPAGLQIFGTGGVAGAAVLESSTDLKAWTPAMNSTLTGGEVRFDDNLGGSRKFYRLRQP